MKIKNRRTFKEVQKEGYNLGYEAGYKAGYKKGLIERAYIGKC